MLGFYNVLKPTGQNSTKIVSAVKHVTGQKSGHLGTLDPMAGGVLPVAVGKATKLFDWFLNKDKKYFAIALFGKLTDTLDSEGVVELNQDVDIKKTQIESILPEFCGEIEQIPPKFSAININGKRAYDLAREGKQVEMPLRKVNIYSLSVEEISKNMFGFNIHCSAGTYVRSLMLDIAKRLGTVATTVCIIRLVSGKFNLSNACTLDELDNGSAKLIKIEDVIDLPKIEINDLKKQRLLNGATISVSKEDGQYLCYSSSKLLGIVKVTNNQILKLDVNLWEDAND